LNNLALEFIFPNYDAVIQAIRRMSNVFLFQDSRFLACKVLIKNCINLLRTCDVINEKITLLSD